ncbi:nucleoside monophosphate kinase [Candidatus Daviesbacteria bacterium]|nr:nucleoside monophosphate kinase [Candidatus Daviesbacteria bacterium]
MRILIAGLPGTGKSTQAHKISQNLGFHLIQMGESLRKIASEGSELGARIKDIMHKGELVDDETVAQVIKEAIDEADGNSNIAMEGYPRSVSQVKVFDPGFDKVFFLSLSEEEMLKRLLDRGRSDDTPEAVKVRIQVQKAGLDEVLREYKDKGTAVIEIDASQSIDEVFESIAKNLR